MVGDEVNDAPALTRADLDLAVSSGTEVTLGGALGTLGVNAAAAEGATGRRVMGNSIG